MRASQSAKQRGIALVAVIWIVASLSVLVLSFNASVRSHLDIASTELAITRSNATIEAALRLAVLKLLEKNPKQRWMSDGRAYDVDVLSNRTRISIQDHKGLININGASKELLEATLELHVDGTAKVQRMARDIKQGLGTRKQPEEQAKTKQRLPFADIVELSNLPGFDDQLVRRIEPMMTVYGGRPTNKKTKPPAAAGGAVPTPEPRAPAQGRPPAKSGQRVNAMTAPRVVLQALPGITTDLVTRVMKARSAGDPQSTRQVATLLRPWQHLTTAGKPGPSYRIRIEVIDKNAVPAAMAINVLLNAGKAPYHVLDERTVATSVRR